MRAAAGPEHSPKVPVSIASSREIAMTTFSRLRSELGDDVEEQLAQLRKEVAHLKKGLARRGSHGYAAGHEHLSELYDDLQERMAELMPHLRNHARSAGRAMRDNSTPIVVGAVVVGLLAVLFASSRR
jgi:hypothetical protein